MRILVVSTVFLAAVVCLAKSQLQNQIYSQLGGDLKKFVDLTIIRANQQLNYSHLNFEGTGPIARVPRDSGVVIDVRLRATTCRKATGTNEYKHRPECSFKRTKVRCMVCSEHGAPQALRNENNYLIDCVGRRDEHTEGQEESSCSIEDGGVTPTTDLSNFIKKPSVPVITALVDIPEASVQTR